MNKNIDAYELICNTYRMFIVCLRDHNLQSIVFKKRVSIECLSIYNVNNRWVNGIK